MASVESAQSGNLDGPPTKRQRIDGTHTNAAAVETTFEAPLDSKMEVDSLQNSSKTEEIIAQTMGYQADKESDAGILRYVNEADQGFSGILKQRYVVSLKQLPLTPIICIILHIHAFQTSQMSASLCTSTVSFP